MKLATTGLVLAMIMSPAAVAQVTDLTGSVQSQTRGTLSTTTGQTARGALDQRTGIDSRLNRQTDLDSRLNQQTDLDTRLDNRVDTDLGVDDSIDASADATMDAQTRMNQSVYSSLTAYDRTRASTRLASQLEQRSQIYARGSASVDTPDRPSVYAGSSNNGGSTHVVVYSRDGYRIGSVTRYDSDTNGRIYFDRSGINTDGVVAVSQGDAMFDADAQAIVLNATRADVSGMASVG